MRCRTLDEVVVVVVVVVEDDMLALTTFWSDEDEAVERERGNLDKKPKTARLAKANPMSFLLLCVCESFVCGWTGLNLTMALGTRYDLDPPTNLIDSDVTFLSSVDTSHPSQTPFQYISAF